MTSNNPPTKIEESVCCDGSCLTCAHGMLIYCDEEISIVGVKCGLTAEEHDTEHCCPQYAVHADRIIRTILPGTPEFEELSATCRACSDIIEIEVRDDE